MMPAGRMAVWTSRRPTCGRSSPAALRHVRPRGARVHDAGRRRARGEPRPSSRRRAPPPSGSAASTRVTAERHGAIRVGTRASCARSAQIFAAMGMYPVGFYDLRDAAPSRRAGGVDGVPAGRRRRAGAQPVPGLHLAARDRRPALLHRRAAAPARGVPGPAQAVPARAARRWPTARRPTTACRPTDADRFLDLATAAFALSREPVDRAWYRELEQVSAVAADIGGVASTHINHLTPRVLDIDELYARMQERGIAMIDEIQGPPRWDGPDVLLRQTSFRALAEPRGFRRADGTVHGCAAGALRRGRGARHRADPGRARPLRRDAASPTCRGTERELAAWTTSPSSPYEPSGRTGRRDGAAAGRGPRGLLDGGWVRAAAGRLRGLPAALGGRHLPVQPRRRRRARQHPGRRRPRRRWLAGVLDRPAADPSSCTPRSGTWLDGRAPCVLSALDDTDRTS